MTDATLPSFHPHPFLRGAHAQTLAGVYLPSDYTPHTATPRLVRLTDGDQLVLHDDCPIQWTSDHGVCMLIHGLGGCRLSGYMRRIAAKLVSCGIRVFRMDMRGCGAGEGLARMSTHCGRWADAGAAIEYIARVAPNSPVALVGFSLGGTIALNLAAELGAAPLGNLRAIMAVCPPIDLHAVKRRFATTVGRAYDRHFASILWAKTQQRSAEVPNFPLVNVPRPPRRLHEYDEWFTAPWAGFASADEYYTATSPAPRLSTIRMPLLILASQDDPVVPFEPLASLPRFESIQVVATRHGGHLGYIAQRGADPDSRWMDWRVVDWACTVLGTGDSAFRPSYSPTTRLTLAGGP